MFENVQKVYMIGIGGISMSAIAMQLKIKGFKVCGSDSLLSDATNCLIKNGIKVVQDSSKTMVEWCDLCVISGAISEDHPDVILAKAMGKTVLYRQQVLAFLAGEKKCIAVSGTHGKTTTTGMLATILLKAGLDPTVHIGGVLNEINSNLHIGKGEYFLTEACEYKDSFLVFAPYISVVLNIDSDHMDYFKNMDNLYNSFKKFTKNTEKYGFCVLNYQIIDNFNAENTNILTFGKGGNVEARDVKEYLPGRFKYNLYVDKMLIDEIKLSAFGKHNVDNSLAVISVALLLNVELDIIKKGLLEYQGVARRMEKVCNNPMIIHDYAHHPTEIEATLEACKAINQKVIAIFQPHLYSRTLDLYKQFLTCFNFATEVWLLPIYAAREIDMNEVSSKMLADDLAAAGICSRYVESFDECKRLIRQAPQDALFVLLGAGDIEKLAQSLKNIEKTI